MRTFNFGLLTVLSCIAMIGATPIGNDAPAGAIGRRQQPPPIPCITTEPEPLPYGCDPSLTLGGSDAIGRRQLPIPCITTDPVPFPFGCDPNSGSGGGDDAISRRQLPIPCITTDPVPFPFGCDANSGSGGGDSGDA